MKNEILDTPFNDSLNDLLEKGEAIIWTGQPQRNYSLDRFELTILVTLIFLSFVSWASSKNVFIFITAIALFFGWLIFTSKKKDIKEGKYTQYALSQKRIFYEFRNKKTLKVFFTPIENIKEITVTRNIIYINTKKKELMPFDLFDFQEPITRRQHQLRDIDEIEMVAQLIKNEMAKKEK